MEEFLKMLNPQQRAAVEHEGSPLLILAGAGSGKTRVITTKIAYLIAERGVDPYQILAVTFTKKAANEMHQRAVALEGRATFCQIRTFHSFGAWFLRLNAGAAGVDPNFTVYDDDDMVTLLAKANPQLQRKQATHFAHLISLCKDYGLLAEDEDKIYKLMNSLGEALDTQDDFPKIYSNYTKRLRETGNVDFGDLILLPMLVLEKNEQVRAYIQNRFKIIMVDEYQDSNVAQFRLLKALAGPQTYVCVVGDDDQSIYKFRGAEVQNILQFKNVFPGTTIIRLESNYRSKSQILEVANDVIKNNSDRLGKSLVAERGDGKKPVLAFMPDQNEETQFCADLVEQTHERGVPYSDWAILYRTNAQSMVFESEFLRRKIPYRVVGSLKFYEREEIKDILAYLALLANPRDEIAFRRIINKPARGIGNASQDKLVDFYRQEYFAQNQNEENAEVAENSDTAETKPVNYVESCRANANTFSKKAREGINSFVEIMDLFAQKIKENICAKDENDRIALEKENIKQLTQNKAQAALALSGDSTLPAANESAENEESQENSTEKIQNVEKLSALIEFIAEKSGLKNYYSEKDEISGTQRDSNIQELANSAVFYDSTRQGLLDFLDHIELDRTLELADEDTEADCVTLITLHNTKGLEFSRVVITGMEYGIFPRQDKYGSELEEERRLCYVGITRAKDELYMTACSKRIMYGRIEYMGPSPFLQEIDPDRLKILGHLPFGFKKSSSAKAVTSHNGDFGELGLSHPDTQTDPIKRKYCRGTKIFHDDYGYGTIISSTTTEDDQYAVTIQFENGGIKKFLPKYQEKSLQVIKE